MKIGESSAIPIIRIFKNHLLVKQNYYIFDSPPGASCPVVETLRGMQNIILVTESSPFGLHDLKNVIEICREMDIPHRVIINRYDENFSDLENFLEKQHIPILFKIPFNRAIAPIYSLGKLYSKVNSKFEHHLMEVVKKIEDNIRETNRYH